VINPATQQTFGPRPEGDGADVDAAVSVARRAFDSGPWKDVTSQERGRILFASLRSSASTLPSGPELETINNGKPIVESEFDIADVATCFEYYGGLATKIHGDVIPVPDNALSLALREPVGLRGKSFRGTTRSSWRRGSSHRRSAQAARWCSARRANHR